jgi:hypothetical protein
MLKLEIGQTQDMLSVVEDNILLAGSPGLLEGVISLRNNSAEPLRVKNVSCWLQMGKNRIPSSFPLQLLLAAGQTRVYSLNFQLDPQTKPGEYPALISVGHHEVPTRLLVEENQEIALAPQEIIIKKLKPGQSAQTKVRLHNLGNVPIEVPEARHRAMFDPFLISRKLGEALLEKGKEGAMPVLENFVQTLLQDIDFHLEMKIKEAKQVLAPGESLDLHLSITAAKETPANDKTELNIEILNKPLRVLLKSPTLKPGASSTKIKNLKTKNHE